MGDGAPAGDFPVRDQLDTATQVAQFRDQPLVPRTVEHAGDDLGRPAALASAPAGAGWARAGGGAGGRSGRGRCSRQGVGSGGSRAVARAVEWMLWAGEGARSMTPSG